MSSRTVKDQLMTRGVLMDLPETVYVADDVKPERIAPGVRIHAGCRLEGAALAMGPGSSLGIEAPVTLVDSQLGGGRDVAWNFEKFLVDRSGQVVGRYKSSVKPNSAALRSDIASALGS